MIWRKTDGGYNANPYQVRWLNGGKWLARLTQRAMSPESLGTYDTANEARAACEGHRKACVEAWESAGFGEK
jgi:hypothetical protein